MAAARRDPAEVLWMVRQHLLGRFPKAVWDVPFREVCLFLRDSVKREEARISEKGVWAVRTSVRPVAVEAGWDGPRVLYWRGSTLWRAAIRGARVTESPASRDLSAVLNPAYGKVVCSTKKGGEDVVAVAGMVSGTTGQGFALATALKVTPLKESVVGHVRVHSHSEVTDVAWFGDDRLRMVVTKATGEQQVETQTSERVFCRTRDVHERHAAVPVRKLVDGNAHICRFMVSEEAPSFVAVNAVQINIDDARDANLMDFWFQGWENSDSFYVEPTTVASVREAGASEFYLDQIRHPEHAREFCRLQLSERPDWFRTAFQDPYRAFMGRADELLRATVHYTWTETQAARVPVAAGEPIGEPLARSPGARFIVCRLGQTEQWVLIDTENAPWTNEA